jgi:hypothetical protein
MNRDNTEATGIEFPVEPRAWEDVARATAKRGLLSGERCHVPGTYGL